MKSQYKSISKEHYISLSLSLSLSQHLHLVTHGTYEMPLINYDNDHQWAKTTTSIPCVWVCARVCKRLSHWEAPAISMPFHAFGMHNDANGNNKNDSIFFWIELQK